MRPARRGAEVALGAAAFVAIATATLGCESIIGLRDMEGRAEPPPGAAGAPGASPATTPAPELPPAVLVDSGTPDGGRLALVLPRRLALGSTHSCAIDENGAARCWGGNAMGQLGANAPPVSDEARVVPGLPRALAISAGAGHSCVIANDGKVHCWGRAEQGQLGGTPARSGAPVVVSLGALTARQVATGALHSCALLSDSSVRCWGDNGQGQLGKSDRSPTKDVVTPAGLEGGVIAVFAAGFFGCALRENGALVCWGDNAYGQLGDRTKTSRAAPVSVRDLGESVRDVALGQSTSCVVGASGGVHCWGRNRPLGDPTGAGIVQPRLDAATEMTSPTPLAGLALTQSLSVGATHACARTLSDRTVCWGSNARMQLGASESDAGPSAGFVETNASLAGAVREIAVGLGHSCALASNDEVFCWGNNDQAQLGAPASPPRAKAERVKVLGR